MLCFKVFTIFLVALSLMPEQAFGHFWWNKCFMKKCSNYGSPVYTKDGTDCLILPNSCYLKNENCARRRLNQPGNLNISVLFFYIIPKKYV